MSARLWFPYLYCFLSLLKGHLAWQGMFLLLSIHMNKKEGPLGLWKNFSHHLAMIQKIPSWRTFSKKHIYSHWLQKLMNTMCNREDNKYSCSIFHIEMEEQGSLFTLKSSSPNVPESGAPTIILYFIWAEKVLLHPNTSQSSGIQEVEAGFQSSTSAFPKPQV